MAKTRVRPYPRVSTDEQALTGYSLDAQREAITKYVADHADWQIADWYVDDGYSAKSLKRPAMQRLLADVQTNDVVLVAKLDRLTRNIADLQTLVDLFEKNNVSLHSVHERIDTSTANGRFFLRMIIEVAQWERETIAERVTAAMRKLIADGRWKGGPTPFGYRAVPSDRTKKNGTSPVHRLDIDPATAPIVVEMFNRYLAGQGVRAIAKWLNETVVVNTSRNAPWRSQAVIRILTNPFFTGKNVLRLSDSDVLTYPGEHPAIIDEATFNRVQSLFAARKLVAPRQATGKYPLSGPCKCGCESSLTVATHTKRGFYTYKCRNYQIGRGCPIGLTSFVGHIAEAKVRDAIAGLLEGDVLVGKFEQAKKEIEAKLGTTADEVRRLRSELASTKQKIKRWDDALETGELAQSKYFERVKPLEAQVVALEARLDSLDRATPVLPSIDDIRTSADLFVRTWDVVEPHERKALLQQFIATYHVKIRLWPGQRVTVDFDFASGDAS